MVNTMFPDSACKATVNTITTQFVRLWSKQSFLTQLVRRQSTPLPPISPLPPITVTLYANPVSTVTTKFVSLWPTRCYVTHLVMLQSTPLSLTLYCNSTHHYHSLCIAIVHTIITHFVRLYSTPPELPDWSGMLALETRVAKASMACWFAVTI